MELPEAQCMCCCLPTFMKSFAADEHFSKWVEELIHSNFLRLKLLSQSKNHETSYNGISVPEFPWCGNPSVGGMKRGSGACLAPCYKVKALPGCESGAEDTPESSKLVVVALMLVRDCHIQAIHTLSSGISAWNITIKTTQISAVPCNSIQAAHCWANKYSSTCSILRFLPLSSVYYWRTIQFLTQRIVVANVTRQSHSLPVSELFPSPDCCEEARCTATLWNWVFLVGSFFSFFFFFRCEVLL